MASAAKVSRLAESFFDRSCETVARELLGKVLCKRDGGGGGVVMRGRIVEIEMYPGNVDHASHSFNNKKTRRNGAMFMQPGTAYVYIIYGMYNCFNISTKETGGAVLIRALEPIEGEDSMRENRLRSAKTKSPQKKPPSSKDLCSGPSKLCQSLDITRDNTNEMFLCEDSSQVWVEDAATVGDASVRRSKRVGIDGAGAESRDKLFRFYEKGNPNVSVVDKEDKPLLRKVKAKVAADPEAAAQDKEQPDPQPQQTQTLSLHLPHANPIDGGKETGDHPKNEDEQS